MNTCRCWATVLFAVLVLPNVAASADAAKEACETGKPTGKPSPDLRGSLLDEDADLPELQTFMQSGPNDVRDILVVDDGFLAATGTAIIRYRYSGDVPVASATYTDRDGLPSGNCYLLKKDADGGTWANCQGGIAYLAAKSTRWKSFTEKNGLAPGNVTNLALSSDEARIWVTSTGGLSTARVKDRAWQAFPKKNLLDILVHPAKDVVWCRRLIASRCMCGRHITSLQFDLETRGWRRFQSRATVPTWHRLRLASASDGGLLWMSAGYDPPMLYDLKANTTRTWSKEPNWERLTNGNTVAYSDWFGDMVSTMGDEGIAWFATNAGLWHYDVKKNDWQGHLNNTKPGCGQALLAKGNDGKTLYWACEGRISAYDIRTGKWTDLWHVAIDSLVEDKHQLTLSADGRSLWLLGTGAIFVGNPSSGKAVTLSDKEQPGLTAAKFVCFDPSRRLALIGTPQGVVGADYGGELKFVLNRPAPPILDKVWRFAFAPDGSEVWCLMMDRAPAAVLYPNANRWEVIPDPKTASGFLDIQFSRDGKTVWMSRAAGGDDDQHVVQRRVGTLKWEPLSATLPRYFGNVEYLWSAPRGNELWMGTWGSGLLRADLASGRVIYYGGPGSRPMQPPLLDGHTIIGDYIKDVAFASHGKIAICSASAGGGGNDGLSVIDLATGKAANYPKKDFYGCATRCRAG